jgi:predicted phosphodiesterase
MELATNVDSSLGIRRLGVIGDVHAHAELLRRAADALIATGVDAIACVGDIYGPGTETAECCRLLAQHQILTVRGNHDRWLLEAAANDDALHAAVGPDTIAFLSTLPATREINTAMGLALVCHGLGANDLAHLPLTFPDSFVRRSIRLGQLSSRHRLVLHGHSHLHRQQTREGVLFITVGKLQTQAGCMIVDTHTRVVTPIAY